MTKEQRKHRRMAKKTWEMIIRTIDYRRIESIRFEQASSLADYPLNFDWPGYILTCKTLTINYF